MLLTAALIPQEQHFIFSTLSPSPAQRRVALGIAVGILVVYALITFGPLRDVRLDRIPAFVPAYATWMFVCDTITAALLYSQFSIVRAQATLVIATGYLFFALCLIPWVLVFPGFFVEGRSLMGGMQSTSWIYFVQHAGFPLFIIWYALSKDSDSGTRTWRSSPHRTIALTFALTVAVVGLVALICIAGEARLPPVVLDSVHLGPLWPYFGAPVGLLSAAAIIVLWRRRRTALDLWLMVVMLLFSIEIPLSYYPLAERFSVGWYAVRIFGIVSSTIVLVLLLREITTLYARLHGADVARRREREARLLTGDAVAATIAHEVRQPLTAMITSADAGFRFLDRDVPNLDRAKESFKRIVTDGYRAGEVVESIRANFKNDDKTKTALDVKGMIEDALALERNELQRHRILVQIEPSGELPKVRANKVQLQQVLLNLITNAMDAMAARDGPRVLRIRSDVCEEGGVTISVADTGPGITPEHAARIFNPLFTTKSEGMGMGLSICKAIIEAHDGRMWFSPNTPSGAVFHFTLVADVPAPRGG